jgi:hypothetical protein
MILFTNNPDFPWQYAEDLNQPFIKTEILLHDALPRSKNAHF